MSDKIPSKPLTGEQKQAMKTMRERIGPVSAERREANKQLLKAKKAIRALLADKPATVPQIAAAVGLPADQVLWYVTAMKKYGETREVGQDGDYVQYALIEQTPSSEESGGAEKKSA